MDQKEYSDKFNELRGRKHDQVLKVRAWVYFLMIIYILVVCVNAMSIVIIFWLRTFGITSVSYEILAAWAIGSGGLGAGSLIFRVPIKELFRDVI